MNSNEEEGLVEKVSSERSLSQDKFLDVIAYADALRRFDELKGDRRLLDSITKSLDEEVPLSIVYQSAKELSIPEEYVRKALTIRYPSAEEKLADIKEYGAAPSMGVISLTYDRELLNTLKAKVPIYKFGTEITDNGIYSLGSHRMRFYRTIEEEDEIRFLFWKITQKYHTNEGLADLYFKPDYEKGIPMGKFGLTVVLKDPLFLHACGEKLKELNERHKNQMHFYVIEHYY